MIPNTNIKSCHVKSFLFFTVIAVLTIASVSVLSFFLSFVYAEKEEVGINSGLSTKTNLGNTAISANSSAQASVSAGSSAGEKTKASNENSQARTSAQAEYHESLKSSYTKMTADSENSFTVETEKHLYKPGETVKIEGSIWSNLVTQVGGINLVSLQVDDNKGNVVDDTKAQVNSNGNYETDFTIPDNAQQGAYTINAKIEVNSNTFVSLPLKTQASLQSSAKFVVVSPNAFAVKAEGKEFQVQIASNSNISNLDFDEKAKKISFTVSGETGTKGVTEITIPKSLLSGDLTIMIDEQVMAHDDVIETVDAQDSATLELNYHHSTHTIDIVGTNAVPEFPSSIILVISAIGFLAIMTLTKTHLIARKF